MTPDEIVWLLALMLLLALAGVFCLGYYCGREDTTDPAPRPAPDSARPYRAGPADFDLWMLEVNERDLGGRRLAATQPGQLLRDQAAGDFGYRDTSALHAIPDARADDSAEQEGTEI